ncbi:MAG: hypothetical protein ACOYKR_09755 [Sphingobacterium thalpophilum]
MATRKVGTGILVFRRDGRYSHRDVGVKPDPALAGQVLTQKLSGCDWRIVLKKCGRQKT